MVSVVFIKRGIAETGLTLIPYTHMSGITNQSLYLFLISPSNELRTSLNRTPAIMADRSELACHHWLDKELTWGMDMILSRKRSQG